MAAAERRLAPYWSMTRSQVYRELPALAEQGLVRLGKPGPRSSQPYAITASGKRTFSRWLAENPGRDTIRNPIALRVAFGNLHSASQLHRACTPRPTNTTPRPSPRPGSRRRTPRRDGETYGASRAGVRRRLPPGGPVLVEVRPRRVTAPTAGATAPRTASSHAGSAATSTLDCRDRCRLRRTAQGPRRDPAQHRGRARPRPAASRTRPTSSRRPPPPTCGTTRPRPSR